MNGWPTIPFRETGTWLSGGTPRRDEPAFWGGDIPWVGTKDLKTFDLDDSSEFVTDAGVAAGTRVVDPGSVLFVVRGMSLAKEFRVGVATRRVAFNQDVKAIVPRSSIDGRFLAWFLRAKERYVLDQCDTATHGTKRLPLERIDGMAVPCPPLPEQRRIAAILDEADALRRKRREALGLLDELLRSTFLEMFGDPVTNPRGWPVVRLDAAADIASGVTKGRELNGRATVTVPYMRVANVQDGFIRLDNVNDIEVLPEDVERYRLLPGDLLLTEGGDPDKLGRGAVWYGEIDPCIHQNHIFRVRCDTSKLLPEFGSTILGSDLGKRYFARSAKQTTGIASINMTQLRGAPVLLPPLTEQRRWEAYVAAHRDQVAARQRQGDEADHLFNALLHAAFTGDL